MSKISKIPYYKERLLRNILGVLDKLITYQRPMYNSDHYRTPTRNGSFPFIPSNTSLVFEDFMMLSNVLFCDKSDLTSSNELQAREAWDCRNNCNDGIKFLDAGCGIGNIMLIAKVIELGTSFHGIEYFDDTYQKALNWLGISGRGKSEEYKIFKKDILDFTKYHDYDIIYYYRPFEDTSSQIKFEMLVENSMKIGGILIPRSKRGIVQITEDKRFRSIFDRSECIEPMYIKVSE